MTVWHWVRHGPTHEKSFVGWRDVPADLSDITMIERVRGHLPQKAVMVSSDLIRSVATADALTGLAHTRLPHEKDLREIDFGVWDGMRFDAVAARDPELSRAFWEKPGDIAAPDGESWNQTAARVDRVVDRLSAAHPDTHIIAVAHFGVILTQVQRASGVSAYEAMSHKIDNISVTTLHHAGGEQWRVEQINHLP
ncbi:histidine phosphatase family protein [Sulfitobacter donghicola]|uniref:Phosphoglycerate mutase n=1 Tax=Sulfitobacter donghicola DSW-25 = KCTC 12864 = JCM 14565 TaxID=1300350 RepID=A0A073IUN5_9RHOB|nr:histidine phosphatase family protein [Sulfitobacter donghicola]KEJ89087.1 phosphoglycerate mutase [Sulfitobacter donghicola DSW-25 = KCTC 12864 = JCM 14565]KIN67337.1 Phosphoglycerate mutase [Sulfitobacter donghicola DSW-25 = KCTC 12864 = JCM 14565]